MMPEKESRKCPVSGRGCRGRKTRHRAREQDSGRERDENMQDQKLENVLNLALGATPEELERSETLAVGYDPEEETWEVIVRHSRPLEGLEEMGVRQEELLNQYSILTVPRSKLEELSALPQVEYIEKPKRLYFALSQAKAASCITYVQVENSSYLPYLTGKECLVAVIDSGIDYFHEDFRREDGTTRILELWDQTLGKVFTETEINEALKKGSRILLEGLKIPPPDSVAEMLDYAASALRPAGYAPYYLYRQKYMSGSFENIGWSLPGAQCLYNIYIMSELCSILSFGAGGSTKMVVPGTNRIERTFNLKYPQEYTARPEKHLANQRLFASFYEKLFNA